MHVENGRQIVEMMVAEFSMGRLPQISVLFNVVAYHHKNWEFPRSARGPKFYPSAVDALESRRAAIAAIQSQFAESFFD